jgi:peroxiredoxin
MITDKSHGFTRIGDFMLKQILLFAAVALFAVSFSQALADEPSTQPVDEKTKAEVDAMKSAYSNLKSLTLSGTVSENFNAGGIERHNSLAFDSAYQAPNKFHQQIKDDALVGSTGSKWYVYHAVKNAYATQDLGGDKLKSSEIPADLASAIQLQNPSLWLAVAENGYDDLAKGATSIALGPDEKIDDHAYTTLLVKSDEVALTLLLDKDSHLVRQAREDFSGLLTRNGQTNVSSALLTIDYAKTAHDQQIDEAQFAWAPPADAQDVTQQLAANTGQDQEASKLEGMAAPDFTLKDIDGNDVKLSSLKGSVVVLDFWATWCGPCVAALPHLQKIYDEQSPKGLKVYTIDLQETKDQVVQFRQSKKLTMPTLLDSEGKVAETYGVEGIPCTIVVGKDGKVAKVFVGYGPDSEEKLSNAIQAAMAM